MSKKQQLSDLKQSFYMEQRRWPFAHASLTIALYFITRDPILSLLLCYLWESSELLLSFKWKSFRENIGDKLLGDPLVGALSIFTFWFIDRVTHWDRILLEHVNVWIRIASFAILMLLSFVTIDLDIPLGKLERGSPYTIPHIGALLYASLYVIVVILFYARYPELDENLSVWITVVVFYGFIASLRVDVPSTFIRVVSAQIAVFILSVIFWAIYI